LTEADLKKSDAEILILLSATDETFASIVHTRSSYKTSEVKFKCKFVNMYNEVKDGAPLSIDINKLSQIEKVEK
jgi:inward rectifier potassium channel